MQAVTAALGATGSSPIHCSANTTRTAQRRVLAQRSHRDTPACRCSAAQPTNEPSEQPPGTAALEQATAVTCLALPPAPGLCGASPQGRWNAVSLAYLGDAVWEALLRSRFYDAGNSWQYGNTVAAMVNTQAQAVCYQLLLDGGWVQPGEAALMRWACNSSSVSPPAHATRQQYKQATAVEALVAHLYLTDTARLQQLLDWLLDPCRVDKWRPPMPVQAKVQRAAQHRQARRSSGNSNGGSSSSSNIGGRVQQRSTGAKAGSQSSGEKGATNTSETGHRRVRGSGRAWSKGKS